MGTEARARLSRARPHWAAGLPKRFWVSIGLFWARLGTRAQGGRAKTANCATYSRLEAAKSHKKSQLQKKTNKKSLPPPRSRGQ